MSTPANRLQDQLDTHHRWRANPRRAADEFHQRWDELLGDFAEANGWRRTHSEFGLTALAKQKGLGGGWRPEDHTWPARDHYSYFHRKRRTAAIVTEPYLTESIADLRRVVEARGLGLYAPPNPRASFWYPGWTNFLVIAREPVVWLPEQLAFEGGDPETLAEVNRWLGR